MQIDKEFNFMLILGIFNFYFCLLYFGLTHWLSLIVLSVFLATLLLYVLYMKLELKKKNTLLEEQKEIIKEGHEMISVVNMLVPFEYIQKVQKELNRTDKVIKIKFKK